MQRRNFIKLTASAQALVMMPSDIMAMYRTLQVNSCPINTDKKLVLIQLDGANDGLNTLVPLNQYDLYSTLRPAIKLSLSGANKVISLDSTLPLTGQVGLHPALTGFKSLYDAGLMRIVQGVGYPNQDKSHFKSTDLWLTGGDGTPDNNTIKSGWMGRFLERYYAEFLSASFPLGIQLGSSNNSLGFHGAEHAALSMNLNNQDLNGYYSIVNGLGGEPPANIPASEYGSLLQYILANDATTNVYANSITTAFTAGSNAATYPNTGLANQLKTVAKLISGGLKTKMYLVRIGGFDTHEGQVESGSPHLGAHANLLKQLGDAVQAFVNDLRSQNLGDDVLGLTFSEFGRKIAQNASLGTDHGEVAPMFLFGSVVQPGVSGTNINLSEATQANNFQVQTVQFDYRRVFATVLQDWLGASTQTLNHTLFDLTANSGFATQKIPMVLRDAHMVPAQCLGDTVLSTDKPEVRKEPRVFPNPASEDIQLEGWENIQRVGLINAGGREIKSWNGPFAAGNLRLRLEGVPAGLYLLQVKTPAGLSTKKLVVRR